MDVGLVCVPLIALLVDSVSWVDATTYSLLAVALGALLAWIPKRKQTHYLTALQLAVFSLSGSLLMVRLKLSVPSSLLACLFAAVAIATVIFWYRDFRTRKLSAIAVSRNREPARHQEWFTSLAGIATGSLITISGLSSHFFVFPYLLKTVRLNRPTAAATAHFTIFLSAAGSLLLQSRIFAFTPGVSELAVFLFGLIAAWVASRLLVKKIARQK